AQWTTSVGRRNSVCLCLIGLGRVCLFAEEGASMTPIGGHAGASIAPRALRFALKVGVGGFSLALLAQVLGALLIGYGASAQPALQRRSSDADTVRVTPEQMHQLSIVKVVPYPFRLQKQAVGQIAFNEDASTVVLTPFSGRVTRIIGK